MENNSLTGPLSRSLWKVCKTFHILPEDLKKLTQFQLDWALVNIRKDEEEELKKLKDIFEILKPWLNLNLYTQEQKRKEEEKNKESNPVFEQELSKHGMSNEDIKKFNQDKIQINELEDEVMRELNGK
jgi:hypothetical protein